MNLEIVKKNGKFFILDTETGEIVGKKAGYTSKNEASAAMTTLSGTKTLSKMPVPTEMGAEMPSEMPPAPMMGGAAGGMGGLVDLLKGRRG